MGFSYRPIHAQKVALRCCFEYELPCCIVLLRIRHSPELSHQQWETEWEMERRKTLSAAFVDKIKQPGRYGEGRGSNGLSLRVKTMSTGGTSKCWVQRRRINGKACDIGLESVIRLHRDNWKDSGKGELAYSSRRFSVYWYTVRGVLHGPGWLHRTFLSQGGQLILRQSQLPAQDLFVVLPDERCAPGYPPG